jgi:hypothetical protein
MLAMPGWPGRLVDSVRPYRLVLFKFDHGPSADHVDLTKSQPETCIYRQNYYAWVHIRRFCRERPFYTGNVE